MGDVHRLLENYEMALSYHQKALNIQESVSCSPLECATIYANIGETYREMKDYATALAFFQKALEIHERNLPNDHPDLAVINHSLAKLYLATREHSIFNICSKPPSATPQWWNTFVRIKHDKGNIIPFVQCTKCLSIFAYESCKTGSSTHKAHAEGCLGGSSPSSSKNQDIIVMMNKDNNSNILADLKSVFTETCAKFCAYDLHPYESIRGHGFQILCQSLLDLARQNFHPIEAADIIPDPMTISRRQNLESTLKRDICTRWNSTYDTLWSVWLNYNDVEQVLASRKEEQYVSNIDSHVFKDITDLLSVFKIGSEKLSADNVSTLHSILPWFYKFRKSCEIKATDRPCIAQLKKKLLTKPDAKLWLTDIHYIATFLHPETKSLPLLNQNERNEIIKTVKKMLNTLGISNDEDLYQVILINDNDDKKKEKK
ncbi:unnamed protein product [Rotaria sordida]|uniref:Uncharacterized protein n=1 Tax=Rotaria sordida TaxID=392033 RepID=A0A815JX71_9BILA|nr:unnamed protein product [Rotaria sordida]